MREYLICDQANEEIYKRQCKALEDHIPNLTKERELVDVDESRIQRYHLGQNEIFVYNSFYLNAVYIKSDIDLMPYFA